MRGLARLEQGARMPHGSRTAGPTQGGPPGQGLIMVCCTPRDLQRSQSAPAPVKTRDVAAHPAFLAGGPSKWVCAGVERCKYQCTVAERPGCGPRARAGGGKHLRALGGTNCAVAGHAPIAARCHGSGDRPPPWLAPDSAARRPQRAVRSAPPALRAPRLRGRQARSRSAAQVGALALAGPPGALNCTSIAPAAPTPPQIASAPGGWAPPVQLRAPREGVLARHRSTRPSVSAVRAQAACKGVAGGSCSPTARAWPLGGFIDAR